MSKSQFSLSPLLLNLLRGFILATAMGHGLAIAQEAPPVPPVFSFSGFGTAGLVHSSESKADFVATDLQNKGAGASSRWSPYVDSRLGVQLDARFSSDLTGVVQVISEQQYDGDFTPRIEWANIKYNITPDFSIRAGRVVLPSFLLSDARKVGYASPWVRPPAELYNLIPISNSDGVDLSYRFSLGEAKNTVQFMYGEGKARSPSDGSEITGKNGWGVFNTTEYGKTTFRLTYFRTKLTSPASKEIEEQARAFSALTGDPTAAELADKYGQTNKPADIMAVGASYEGDRWFLMGEYGRILTHSAYGDREGGYLSSGYRFGKFTPYVTYAFADVRSNTSDPGLPLTGNPFVDPSIIELNSELNGLLGSAPRQKTYSAGMRWDAYKNVAVKFQFDHSRLHDNSFGLLNNRQPGYTRGGIYNLFSVSVDFLF